MKYDPLEQLEIELKNITSTKTGRRTFIVTLPLILASCATKTSDRYREGSNKGQKAISVQEEQKMTKEYLPQMKKDYPPVRDSYLQGYISEVGQHIVQKNKLNNNPYTYNFTLVDTKAVNAFALPAGTIFVTTPLLAMTASEAELAGVIGHEIGHVTARHSAERIASAQEEQKKSIFYGLGGLLTGGALGYGLSKALCPPKDQECIQRITKYGAMAGAAGGLLIQKYGFMANSREDEMEADRIGFRTSVAAGFDKNHVGLFYEKLLKMEQANKKDNDILASFADAMSTHPPSKERVKQMNQMAKQDNSKQGLVSSKEYLKVKQKIQKLL